MWPACSVRFSKRWLNGYQTLVTTNICRDKYFCRDKNDTSGSSLQSLMVASCGLAPGLSDFET